MSTVEAAALSVSVCHRLQYLDRDTVCTELELKLPACVSVTDLRYHHCVRFGHQLCCQLVLNVKVEELISVRGADVYSSAHHRLWNHTDDDVTSAPDVLPLCSLFIKMILFYQVGIRDLIHQGSQFDERMHVWPVATCNKLRGSAGTKWKVRNICKYLVVQKVIHSSS